MSFPDNNDNPYSKYGKKYANIIQNSPNHRNRQPTTPLPCGPLSKGYTLNFSPIVKFNASSYMNASGYFETLISIVTTEPIFCVNFDLYLSQQTDISTHPTPRDNDFTWVSPNVYQFSLTNKNPTFILKVKMFNSHAPFLQHTGLQFKIIDALTKKDYGFTMGIGFQNTGGLLPYLGLLPISGPWVIYLGPSFSEYKVIVGDGSGFNPNLYNSFTTTKSDAWIWKLWVANDRGFASILNPGKIKPPYPSSSPYFSSYYIPSLQLPASPLYSSYKDDREIIVGCIHVNAKYLNNLGNEQTKVVSIMAPLTPGPINTGPF
jgi:hypothetical protein